MKFAPVSCRRPPISQQWRNGIESDGQLVFFKECLFHPRNGRMRDYAMTDTEAATDEGPVRFESWVRK